MEIQYHSIFFNKMNMKIVILSVEINIQVLCAQKQKAEAKRNKKSPVAGPFARRHYNIVNQ